MDQKSVTYFAKTNFRNKEHVFGIKAEDRLRHFYVIGKTGMGKTTLLETLALQDLKNGHGMAFIDPHGDVAEKLVKLMPSHRINDVIYFNPADQDFPIAFNVMEKVDPRFRHLVASGLVSVFKKLWADSWGPRLEYILRNAILALLEYPGSTLLGVMRILVDKRYRNKVVERITDPVVKSFWVDEYTKWNERVLQEVIAPIQNKVGQFLSSALIRNIVGQTRSSFDIREAMDQKKVIIMNLAKGRMGEDISALIGAMMVTKIQLAAMGRVDTLEHERKDFYLYVDEFQNFATESFANILSEARKYRLGLVLANQYITQIDEVVRDAIFGNVGTIVAFRVGASDAEALEKEFEPIFMANDLVNLQRGNIYLKLMIDGVAGDAFSATTILTKHDDVDNTDKVVKVSRERYAVKKDEVEEKIMRWTEGKPSGDVYTHNVQSVPKKIENIVENTQRGLYPHENNTASSLLSSTKTQQDPQIEKEMYEVRCADCGVKTRVPFKPDGKRPTFCKECLKDHQRVVAKSQVQTLKQQSMQQVQRVPEKKIRENIQRPESQISFKEAVLQKELLSLSKFQDIEPTKFQHSNSGQKSDADKV